MKKKFLSLLVLLSVPVGVLSAATVNGNYETAKKQTNNYITRFTMHPKDFLLFRIRQETMRCS